MGTGALSDIVILILAAGSSSRMGQSKQLLNIAGETLLQRIVARSLEARPKEVVVVLGSNINAHRKVIEDYPIQIISNENWNKGMGSSIKVGIKFIEKNLSKTAATIISVCDQPHLSASHLIEMGQQYYRERKKIIASGYKETFGVPILFDRSFHQELSTIDDSSGAKNMARNFSHEMDLVPFPLGGIDLDTMEDYNTFNA